jgi:pyruvate/2-oxoglutarate dehydrogenase complex dihydrolipoamide acyltransferase (E2) component
MNYLKAACEKLGCDPECVLTHHVYEDHIALVVDNGIKGCPKYEVPLSELVVILEAGEYTASEEVLPDGVQIEGHQGEVEEYIRRGLKKITEALDNYTVEEPDITEGARELALEHRLDISLIEGSGKGGRITKRDVQEVIDAEYS